MLQRQALTDMQSASRQLCKKQLMWFRGDALYSWLDAELPTEHTATSIADAVQAPARAGELILGC